jgi:hypothetical protein
MTLKGLRGATQPSSFSRARLLSVHVHAAHAALAHASTATAIWLAVILSTSGFCRKRGVLGRQMILTAGRASHSARFASAH